MLYQLKSLLFVLAIAWAVFALIKAPQRLLHSPQAFKARRVAWVLLTAAAFLSPTFWTYTIVAVPVMLILGRRDPNPLAAYLMMFQVVPPVSVAVPMVGMSSLFLLDNYLLTSFCILLGPALFAKRTAVAREYAHSVTRSWPLLLFGIVSGVFYVHSQTPVGTIYPGSFTESLRRIFVFVIGSYLPYQVARQYSARREDLVDSLGTLFIFCCIQAAIGVVESATGRLLYADMLSRWGNQDIYQLYLLRDHSLRAAAATGHSLGLGYLLAIGLCLWLGVRLQIRRGLGSLGSGALIGAGLIAAYARGAWIGALMGYVLFEIIFPNRASRKLRAFLSLILVIGAILASPLGDKITQVVPLLGGKVGDFNIIYRERLFERSWDIFLDHPILGDPAALLKMQDLRQGQGIIDMVNTYMGILLSSGLVGLGLFAAFVVPPIVRGLAIIKQLGDDHALAGIGASLISALIALLVMLAGGSFVGAPAQVLFVLVGMIGGYNYFARKSLTTDAGRSSSGDAYNQAGALAE